MARFLVLFTPEPRHAALKTQVTSKLQRMPDKPAIQDNGAWVTATAGGPIVQLGTSLIVGPLFDRRYPAQVQELSAQEQRMILSSRGRHLTKGYWGGYVALIAGASAQDLLVLRAPFGELPCYRISVDGATALASDVGMLMDAGLLRPALRWEAIARELVWRDLRTTETCLEGVNALAGGERLHLSGNSIVVDQLWSPWDHVATVAPRKSEADAVERIRRDVQGCVITRAASYEKPLLMLSGGLDSSIVAACLARSQQPFSVVTLVTRDPIGDEREFGRAMAMLAGIKLHERLRDVSYVSPHLSPAAHLPRPAGRLFEQESARLVQEVAEEVGADVILTGGGGDNVFCALQSAAPVADRLLSEGPRGNFFATAQEISRLAQTGIPAVLRAALARTLPWNRHSPVMPDHTFLAPAARNMAGATMSHPWLNVPRGALPGKAAHIKLLAYADGFLQGVDPQVTLPKVAPLLGQPLVETCLQVPSWQWYRDGRNRDLARRAFARDLPDNITHRRAKGSPESFLGEIYERHRAVLRNMLLEGLLAEHGIIDRDGVEQAFKSSGAMAPSSFGRLLELVDVESWARSWKAHN